MHACTKGIYNNLIESWHLAESSKVRSMQDRQDMNGKQHFRIYQDEISASHFESKNANLDSWIPLSTPFFSWWLPKANFIAKSFQGQKKNSFACLLNAKQNSKHFRKGFGVKYYTDEIRPKNSLHCFLSQNNSTTQRDICLVAYCQ